MGILGPPYCGIGATIRIGREMLCLQYAGFLKVILQGEFKWPGTNKKKHSGKLNVNAFKATVVFKSLLFL